jgi:hypothetical protein
MKVRGLRPLSAHSPILISLNFESRHVDNCLESCGKRPAIPGPGYFCICKYTVTEWAETPNCIQAKMHKDVVEFCVLHVA